MARKWVLKAEAKDNAETEYRFSLEYYIFMEGTDYVVYCPALDISTCAKTYNEAVSSFYEMFQLHIECCVENGTLQDDLLSHGWRVHKKSITPPTVAFIMKKPEMKKLFGSHLSFERVVAPARIPVFA